MSPPLTEVLGVSEQNERFLLHKPPWAVLGCRLVLGEGRGTGGCSPGQLGHWDHDVQLSHSELLPVLFLPFGS